MAERNCSTCAYDGSPIASRRCNECWGTDALNNWSPVARDETTDARTEFVAGTELASEESAEKRIDTIGQNGNDGEHYDLVGDVAALRQIAVETGCFDEMVADMSAATAPDLLQRASDIMLERAKQYDKPEGERSMAAAIVAFNAITGRDLKESDGWLLLQVLKDVRQWTKQEYHADSAEDCIAYAALKAEALAGGL